MKNALIILLLVFLSSCVKVTKSELLTTEGHMIYRHHVDSKTEYKFHYGYDVSEGKMSYHHGYYTEPEKNEVTFRFLEDTVTYNNRELYNRANVIITYKKVYHDGTFHHNQIIKIK